MIHSTSVKKLTSLCKTGGAFAALLVLSSCGAGDKGSTCEVVLSEQGNPQPVLDTTEITHRGTLSEECKKFLYEESGDTAVNVNINAKASSALPLALTAGERSYTAGSSSSLSNGSLQITFGSKTSRETAWKLPWNDKPATVSLTIKYPGATVDKSIIASRISVTFSK